MASKISASYQPDRRTRRGWRHGVASAVSNMAKRLVISISSISGGRRRLSASGKDQWLMSERININGMAAAWRLCGGI